MIIYLSFYTDICGHYLEAPLKIQIQSQKPILLYKIISFAFSSVDLSLREVQIFLWVVIWTSFFNKEGFIFE